MRPPNGPDHDPNAVLSEELKELRKCRPKDASILVKFYMMEGLTDPIMLGLPEMSKIGCFVEPMQDGQLWVQFTQMGNVRLPVLGKKLREGVQLSGKTTVQGPAVYRVKATMTREERDERSA